MIKVDLNLKQSGTSARIYGLIGFPLGHSFSAHYFQQKFDKLKLSNCEYRLFEIERVSDIRNIAAELNVLAGFNVTIPHKRSVMELLDEVSDAAREIGAVNCVQIKDGKWTGHNTDVVGFESSLLSLIRDSRGDFPQQALILGNGGSSKAVQWVLGSLGIDFTIASRRASENTIQYSEISPGKLKNFDLIINTTPLGMYPATGFAPDLPYEYLSDKQLLFDLIYNPEKSLFLTLGTARGCKVKNGLEMLALQAEASWEIWNS